MKKTLLTIGLAALAVSAFGQATWQAQSFLAQGVQSLYVTNLVAITNLNTAGANTTNAPGTAWSNYVAGGTARYVTATNTGSGSWTNATRNLLKDVTLWSRRDGSPAFTPSATNGFSVPTFGDATLVIRVDAGSGSGANTAMSLVFTPLYGYGLDNDSAGLNPRPTAVEGTTADEWTVGITPAGATVVTVTTNVPTYRWPGARALRLRRVVNTDTDPSSQAIVNEITLNGYVP